MAEKPKKLRTPKEKPLKEWQPFLAEEYQQALSQMVHQSFKTVNTNADAGGIRIARSRAAKLPYVSARTLMAAGVDVSLDRYEGAASAKIYGQIEDVDSGRTEGVSNDDLQIIRNGLGEIRDQGFTANGGHLSPRLRQILLPKDGSFVAITPISCVGVSRAIHSAISAHFSAFKAEGESLERGQARTLRYINTASFPIGGSNSQNAGGLIYMMQSPLLVDAPSAAGELRHALSLHYNGLKQIPLPSALMDAYREWLGSIEQKMEGNLDAREANREFMRRFARSVLWVGANAREILLSHQSALPEERLICESMPAWSKGLIEPSRRDSQWAGDMASRIARTISAWEPKGGTALQLGQQDLNNLATYLEEALR